MSNCRFQKGGQHLIQLFARNFSRADRPHEILTEFQHMSRAYIFSRQTVYLYTPPSSSSKPLLSLANLNKMNKKEVSNTYK